MTDERKVFTCESCESQPERVSNGELVSGVKTPLRVTLCLECLELGNSISVNDPRYVALVNRILDFKQAWPLKALTNRVFHAASVMETDKDAALRILRARDGEPPSDAIRKHSTECI